MMPCFNAAATLRMAAASLTLQTLSDWECICLDDGSSDETWDLLVRLHERDRRFRIERFPENRGRGAARQRILELVSGEYLAFQDADDWSYPQRFQHEASWLELDPHIAMVSACAAVTRDGDEAIGVMRPRPGVALPCVMKFDEPVPPPMVFPSSMIRADLAKQTGFDSAFRRSQDSDFVLRGVLGKHLALTSEVIYAYLRLLGNGIDAQRDTRRLQVSNARSHAALARAPVASHEDRRRDRSEDRCISWSVSDRSRATPHCQPLRTRRRRHGA
jgi:glycosyltransferase involved in cell wall biosynthesis